MTAVENRKCSKAFAGIELLVNRRRRRAKEFKRNSETEERQDYKVLLLICVNCRRNWDQDKVGNSDYSKIPERGNKDYLLKFHFRNNCNAILQLGDVTSK